MLECSNFQVWKKILTSRFFRNFEFYVVRIWEETDSKLESPTKYQRWIKTIWNSYIESQMGGVNGISGGGMCDAICVKNAINHNWEALIPYFAIN